MKPRGIKHGVVSGGFGFLAMFAVGCAWIAGVSEDPNLVPEAAAPYDARVPVDASDAADPAEAEPPIDAGPIPEAGLPSDPLGIECGNKSCASATQACCYPTTGFLYCPLTTTACNGVAAACDEAADCSNGQVCCITAIVKFGVQAECKTACTVNDRQACRTTSECNGSACKPWRCAGSDLATCGGAGAGAGCIP